LSNTIIQRAAIMSNALHDRMHGNLNNEKDTWFINVFQKLIMAFMLNKNTLSDIYQLILENDNIENENKTDNKIVNQNIIDIQQITQQS